MKYKIILAGILASSIGLTACGTDRGTEILKACGSGAKIVAIDDDQIVCEPTNGGKQFIREASDDQ